MYIFYILTGTMEMIFGMRRQLLVQLRNLGLVRQRGAGDIKDLNSNSRNWAVIKTVIGSGLYPNFIKVMCQMKTNFSRRLITRNIIRLFTAAMMI